MELPRTPAPRLVAASVVAASGLLLAACSGAAQPAPPASSTTRSAPAPAPLSTTTQGASASSSAATGGAACAPTGQEVPAGAAVAATADLDHDGRADELWLADSTAPTTVPTTGSLERRLGVRTASGAVFSTTCTSASPQGTTAIGQRLDASTSVVLLSDGRQVPLYAVVTGSGGGACQLVPSTDAQGQQYDPEGLQVAAARQVRCGDQGPDTAVAEPAS